MKRDRLAAWLIRMGWRLASPQYRAARRPAASGFQRVIISDNTYTSSAGTVRFTYR